VPPSVRNLRECLMRLVTNAPCTRGGPTAGDAGTRCSSVSPGADHRAVSCGGETVLGDACSIEMIIRSGVAAEAAAYGT